MMFLVWIETGIIFNDFGGTLFISLDIRNNRERFYKLLCDTQVNSILVVGLLLHDMNSVTLVMLCFFLFASGGERNADTYSFILSFKYNMLNFYDIMTCKFDVILS